MSDEESEAENEIVCLRCGNTPCEWITHRQDIEEGRSSMYSEDDGIENHTKRKAMYRLFTF